MEIIAHKGQPFSVFVDEFISHFALLQLYSNCLVILKTSRSNQMIAAILNLLIFLDQEDGYLKNVHSLVGCQTVTNYGAIFFPNFNKWSVEFMQ